MAYQKRGRVVAGAVALAIAWAFSSGGVSGADPSTDPTTHAGDDRGSDAFMESVGKVFLDNQSALSDLTGWILGQPESANSGYIGQVNDAETLSVRLLWHGDDPFLKDVLEQAASRGITATVEKRAMSLKQLDEAVDRIWNEQRRIGRAGFQIDSIGSVGETEGFTISGVYVGALAVPPGESVPSKTQKARQSLADSIAELAGGSVLLVEGASENVGTWSNPALAPHAGGHQVSTGGTVS